MKINDVARETVIVMNYCEPDIFSKVPNKVITRLQQLSANSDKKVKIDHTKELCGLDILEETKDLISLIFYRYIATSEDKLILKKIWNESEMMHQEKLMSKYSADKIFPQDCVEKKENLAMVVNKKNIFQRIIEKFKILLNKIKKILK